MMDQRDHLLIELALLAGGSVHVYDKRGDLLAVIVGVPITE